jgi:D-lactate dehydrogenase (cytochrome)
VAYLFIQFLSGIDHSVVVYPESTEDVVKIVKIANKYKMPITVCYPRDHSEGGSDLFLQPYSGATSLEGQFIGVSE